MSDSEANPAARERHRELRYGLAKVHDFHTAVDDPRTQVLDMDQAVGAIGQTECGMMGWMGGFHVYVEGSVEASPEAMRELADVMATRYGLPAADLLARLSKGRFRVKANVDRATADTYQRDLEAVGARVTIEDAASAPRPSGAPTPSMPGSSARGHTQNQPQGPAGAAKPASPGSPVAVARTASTSVPQVSIPRTAASSSLPQPSLPRTSTSSSVPASSSALPPVSVARTLSSSAVQVSVARTQSSSALPPANLSRAPQPTNPPMFASGLSAAFSGPSDQMESSSLGALEYGDTALSLASLDGQDSSSSGGSFEPPSDMEFAASIGPAASPPTSTPRSAGPSAHPGIPVATLAGAKPELAANQSSARTKDVPLDLFAPPDADEHDVRVDFAVDERRAAKPATPPPPAVTPDPRGAKPSVQPAHAASASRGSAATIRHSSDAPKTTDPAGSSHAGSASAFERLAEPRMRFAAGVVLAIVLGFVPAHFIAAMRERSTYHEIESKLASITATVSPDEAEQAWHNAVTDKRGAQRNIAITSMLIWAAVGGALGSVWFRRVPWDRFAR